jgi:hypothetical protein
MSLNIIQMEDYGLSTVIGKALIPADYLITALQVENARVVGEQLCVADDNRLTDASDFFFGNRFEHHLGSDARWITHSDTYARSGTVSARFR